MQDETRERLKLIVEKGKKIESYSYARHYREQGIQTHYSLNWKEGEGLSFEFKANAPEEEAIMALAALLRYFTQPNEKICLYSDSWLNPRPLQQPDWLNDPALSQEWHDHWEGVRRYITGVLSRLTMLKIDDTDLTYGIIYDAALYGELVHSTKAEQIKQWRSMPMISALVTDALYTALGAAIDGIRKISQASEAELAGKPMAPWNSLLNTKFPKRRRKPRVPSGQPEKVE
jgi:hypothetical protein